jgi:hypothetical protein
LFCFEQLLAYKPLDQPFIIVNVNPLYIFIGHHFLYINLRRNRDSKKSKNEQQQKPHGGAAGRVCPAPRICRRRQRGVGSVMRCSGATPEAVLGRSNAVKRALASPVFLMHTPKRNKQTGSHASTKTPGYVEMPLVCKRRGRVCVCLPCAHTTLRCCTHNKTHNQQSLPRECYKGKQFGTVAPRTGKVRDFGGA